jgi:hypothetical protein
MNQLEAMKARVNKIHDKRLKEKREGWIGPPVGRELSDKELFNKIYKQYESAWKKLARL